MFCKAGTLAAVCFAPPTTVIGLRTDSVDQGDIEVNTANQELEGETVVLAPGEKSDSDTPQDDTTPSSTLPRKVAKGVAGVLSVGALTGGLVYHFQSNQDTEDVGDASVYESNGLPTCNLSDLHSDPECEMLLTYGQDEDVMIGMMANIHAEMESIENDYDHKNLTNVTLEFVNNEKELLMEYDNEFLSELETAMEHGTSGLEPTMAHGSFASLSKVHVTGNSQFIAEMSSEASAASRCIDGNVASPDCHTQYEHNPWLVVKSRYPNNQFSMTAVKIYNRAEDNSACRACNCCTERLFPFKVYTSSSRDGNGDWQVCPGTPAGGFGRNYFNSDLVMTVPCAAEGVERVRVRVEGSQPTYLNLYEVQILSGLVASMPSTYAGSHDGSFDASNCIDGWGDLHSQCHSEYQHKPWLTLTGTTPYDMTGVTIYNRKEDNAGCRACNCCTDRLFPFKVYTSRSLVGDSDWTVCPGTPANGYGRNHFRNAVVLNVPCANQNVKRTRMQIEGSQPTYLNLYDVAIETGPIASMSSLYSGSYQASNCVDGNIDTLCISAHERNPSLTVASVSPVNVNSVTIYNRKEDNSACRACNCCTERLFPFKVYTSASSSGDDWTVCPGTPTNGYTRNDVPYDGIITVPCAAQNVMRTRVQIEANHPTYLNLYEVDVNTVDSYTGGHGYYGGNLVLDNNYMAPYGNSGRHVVSLPATITGDLRLDYLHSGGGDLVIKNLRNVYGSIVVKGGHATHSRIIFEDLHRVNGNFDFAYASPALRSIRAPQLNHIGGSIDLWQDANSWRQSLEELYMPKLRAVQRDIAIRNTNLREVDLSELEYLGDHFRLRDNTLMRVFNVPNVVCQKQVDLERYEECVEHAWWGFGSCTKKSIKYRVDPRFYYVDNVGPECIQIQGNNGGSNFDFCGDYDLYGQRDYYPGREPHYYPGGWNSGGCCQNPDRCPSGGCTNPCARMPRVCQGGCALYPCPLDNHDWNALAHRC